MRRMSTLTMKFVEHCFVNMHVFLHTPWAQQNFCTGGGVRQGKISPSRKVANFSPGEILAEQFHTSPELRGLCLLKALEISRVAKFSPGEPPPPLYAPLYVQGPKMERALPQRQLLHHEASEDEHASQG